LEIFLLGIILKGHGKLEPQRAGFVMRDKELPPLAVVDQRSHQASVSIILAEGLRTSPLFDQDSLNPSDSDPFTLTQVTSIDLKHPQNTKAARKHIVSNDHTQGWGPWEQTLHDSKHRLASRYYFRLS
jgi:hypothetical protein